MAINYNKENKIRYTPENRKEVYFMAETLIKDAILTGDINKQIEAYILANRIMYPDFKDANIDECLTCEPEYQTIKDEYLRSNTLLIDEFEYYLQPIIERKRKEIYLRRLQAITNKNFIELARVNGWEFLRNMRKTKIG